ncbi:MAG: ABC transporter permease subunit [Ignavibacteriales bacterium]|nr:ABC transporter permease subunit [Ignavibacteriales bacterium]
MADKLSNQSYQHYDCYCLAGFGYYMMIFLAGLAVIPKELEEASKIDGANRFQRVTHIIIPMLKPTLILIVRFVINSGNKNIHRSFLS